MKYLFSLLSCVFILQLPLSSLAKNQLIDYKKSDSIKVVKLLRDAAQLSKSTNWMVYFGKQFCGIPYVAKTLENNKTEQLVVNLRQLDCTTFVETTTALSLCMKNGKRTFEDFCYFLRMIRYNHGIVDYSSRLHYFTQWIDDNSSLGFVSEITSANQPFTAIQTLNINFMTSHTELYPMLKDNPINIKTISKQEKLLTGRKFRYIPKSKIVNNKLFRQTIKDGDIIVILTSKKGLDTSHIGIAIWKKDGLHLLNASSLRHKVVVEPKLLYTYMNEQKSQTGIRVVRLR